MEMWPSINFWTWLYNWKTQHFVDDKRNDRQARWWPHHRTPCHNTSTRTNSRQTTQMKTVKKKTQALVMEEQTQTLVMVGYVVIGILRNALVVRNSCQSLSLSCRRRLMSDMQLSWRWRASGEIWAKTKTRTHMKFSERNDTSFHGSEAGHQTKRTSWCKKGTVPEPLLSHHSRQNDVISSKHDIIIYELACAHSQSDHHSRQNDVISSEHDIIIWAAPRENWPNAGCDNVEISWVKVWPLCIGPMYCVTSNCHNSVISKDFLVLFSTTCNLAKRRTFLWKNLKIEFSGVRFVFSWGGSYANAHSQSGYRRDAGTVPSTKTPCWSRQLPPLRKSKKEKKFIMWREFSKNKQQVHWQ